MNARHTNGKGKVVLVTGASSGFGYSIAEALLDDGMIVYGAARSLDKMKPLEAKGLHPIKMDVTDDASVSTGVSRIVEETGRIDVVVNNAGFGTYGVIEAVPMEQVRYQFEVNLFGAGRVMQAVLPHMRKARSGRIINTSSAVAHVSAPVLGWYAATKHALNAISDALRAEVADFGIQVVMIEPGAVKTGFRDVALETLEKVDHPDDYRPLLQGFKAFFARAYKSAPGPESTVKAAREAIEAENPRPVYRTTRDAKLLPGLAALMPTKSFDRLMLSQMKG